MKPKFLILIASLSVASIVFYAIGGACIYGAVASSTVLFHIVIRLVIGFGVGKCSKEFDFRSKFFAEKKREAKFYRLIKLHTLKNLLPAYCEYDFAADPNGSVQKTCVVEVTNAIVIVLTFLPPIFAAIAKSGLEFLIPLGVVSFLLGLYDLFMLLSQRYIRFRMLSLIDRRRQRCQ